jgi:hypothetical protein
MSAPTKDPRFEQLAKEIVFFCQSHPTQESIEFVRYELYLRCISKDFLQEIAKQEDRG